LDFNKTEAAGLTLNFDPCLETKGAGWKLDGFKTASPEKTGFIPGGFSLCFDPEE